MYIVDGDIWNETCRKHIIKKLSGETFKRQNLQWILEYAGTSSWLVDDKAYRRCKQQLVLTDDDPYIQWDNLGMEKQEVLKVGTLQCLTLKDATIN